jgi:formate dehydrogenase subunit gamma
MSLRSTAESHTPAPGLAPDQAAQVRTLVARHADQPGALLPLLHAVQDALGHVPAQAVPLIAQGLNLSRAEVHGVITYYPHFRQLPAGRHVVQICHAEACQACGGDALLAHAEQRLDCAPHHTRADGQVTLDIVYCLGLCASAPALTVDGRLQARVTPARFDQLMNDMLAEHTPAPTSAPTPTQGAAA